MHNIGKPSDSNYSNYHKAPSFYVLLLMLLQFQTQDLILDIWLDFILPQLKEVNFIFADVRAFRLSTHNTPPGSWPVSGRCDLPFINLIKLQLIKRHSWKNEKRSILNGYSWYFTLKYFNWSVSSQVKRTPSNSTGCPNFFTWLYMYKQIAAT